MTIRVIWTDDSSVQGDNAADVITQVASSMWVEADRDRPKAVLAYRAWGLLGVRLDENADDETFLQQMADAGLVRILPNPG